MKIYKIKESYEYNMEHVSEEATTIISAGESSILILLSREKVGPEIHIKFYSTQLKRTGLVCYNNERESREDLERGLKLLRGDNEDI